MEKKLQFLKVTKDTILPQPLKQFPNIGVLIDQEKIAYFSLVAKFSLDYFVHTGVKVSDSEVVAAIQILNRMSNASSIVVYMSSYTNLPSEVERISNAIKDNGPSFKPFQQLYGGKDHDKAIIQSDQMHSYDSLADKTEQKHLMVYPNFESFCLIQAYALYYNEARLAAAAANIAMTRTKAGFFKTPFDRLLIVSPMPLDAHENHLLGTGDKFYLKFEGTARKYSDEDSRGYDNDSDDESPNDAREWAGKVVDNPSLAQKQLWINGWTSSET